MTVNSYTYCTALDIQSLIGDIIGGRVFTTASSPSLAEVESQCDNVAALIHAKLAEEGYISTTNGTLLTNAYLVANYPLVAGFLKSLNIQGACHQVLQSVPGMAVDPSDSEAPNQRANQFKKRFDDGLKSIGGQLIDNLGLARSVRRTQRVTAVQDIDPVTGYHKVPFFTRGMTDISGSRNLTRP